MTTTPYSAEQDREVLELAAKAAGYTKVGELNDDGIWQEDYVSENGFRFLASGWNPLTDDGAALRLAVKLWLLNEHPKLTCNLAVEMQAQGRDPYAATRRAIVRAAAEIGRAMS